MLTANSYEGKTDSERIENAIKNRDGGIVIIPPRIDKTEPERDWWIIDRAILIPDNTTVVLRNCKIKLSDSCRDNFFRSANCGIGISDPAKIRNIHIKGEGYSVLEGADHPRSTGDSTKYLACPCPKTKEDLCRFADWIPNERRFLNMLNFWDEHSHSYGTDAGINDESQRGDWRNIGILFANAEYCSVENLHMVDFHGWGISFEACVFGRIEKINFDACMAKEIDGMIHNIENQDGINIRNGCHDITISDITGGTGDDLIALTAIAEDVCHPGGSLYQTHVMYSDWSRRDRDIHNITIKNVMGYSKGGLCMILRLLPANTKIWNVVIDNIIDTSPNGFRSHAVMLLGCADGEYGKNLPGSISRISISNVICNSNYAIDVQGYLQDSVVSNIVNCNPICPVFRVARKNGMTNVTINSISTIGESLIKEVF